ncbi:hypothetical protein BN874_710004 [Candidatus Contendobacter odensis Run_B_J11]|uniref:Uncharacterized protein n=1 Tax=Candidatus Contendobacter odensis Run_B_J11 TaxID=1400861 RepID=A0A7U7GFQ5_9GAMM|nr:hypothetical protein BN874_710004 [Candidatus Contendobacter odensis Run_B_J11]
MLMPLLLSRMKQWRWQIVSRINTDLFIVFVIIAPLTSQSQIVKHREATLTEWNNMLDGEALHDEFSLTSAILTTMFRTFRNSLPKI